MQKIGKGQFEHLPIAIIGGSGFSELSFLSDQSLSTYSTPYGDVCDLTMGQYNGMPVVFLPRHGKDHHLPPHLINYRANMWALDHIGVKNILALNAVGGIDRVMSPGTLLLPHQIIDYSYGREHTFFTGGDDGVEHIDFTHPYDQDWRHTLKLLTDSLPFPVVGQGVYACTQGPRLETAAEIEKIRRDGGDIVGMTGMPEAALARELHLSYASLAIVVNWAAGVGGELLSMAAIFEVLENSKQPIERFLVEVLNSIRLLGE